MGTFVLVHGSWAWGSLRRALGAAGHESFSPTLSGCAERFDHEDHSVTLQTHVGDVSDLMFYEDLSNVVLVGHSSAGMLLEGIANREAQRIRWIVYLDAYVVDPGQCGYGVWTRKQVEEAQAAARDGRPFRDPLPPAVLGISDGPLARWVAERMTPHPLGCFSEPVPSESTRTQQIPRLYLHCTSGPLASLFRTHADRARNRGWSVCELEAAHDSMLTHTDSLAAALIETLDPTLSVR